MFSCYALFQTNLSSISVGPGDTSQLIDLLPNDADLSLDGVSSLISPDRLKALVGLQYLRPVNNNICRLNRPIGCRHLDLRVCKRLRLP